MALIELNTVSLNIPIYHMNARSIKQQLLRLGTGGKIDVSQHHVFVKALDNISLTLQDGDRIGLIGYNGAGKSTLLRLLSRIYEPTSGTIKIVGKVSPLLDMMLGIQEDATGYENIYLRGIMLGLTKKQIGAKKEEIAAFTELGNYLAAPIRTYSAGMRLRLAFAVATAIESEILVIDEVIGTGDEHFLKKAKERMNHLINKASIVVIASHASEIIQEICNKAIVLEAGKIKFIGDPVEALYIYKEHNHFDLN